MAKGRTSALAPPRGVRALVPVLAAAGGSGRSAVAGLLAQAYALATRTVLIDPSPRAVSPWADWLGVGVARAEGAGLTALAQVADGRGLDAARIWEASTRRIVPLGKVRRSELPSGLDGPDGIGYDVLADTRPWTRAPVPVPEDPRWYARLVGLGGWSAGVIDVGVPIVASHLAARQAVRMSLLDAWMRRADAVPVLVTAATGYGAQALARLVMALEQDGISAEHLVVAVVNTAGTDPPRWMHTELAQLSGRVADLVEIPYDKAIRADGLARLDDLNDGTLDAARRIGRTVAGLVTHHDDVPDADEPYVFQPGGAPATMADPGATTADRYSAEDARRRGLVRPARAASTSPHPESPPGPPPSLSPSSPPRSPLNEEVTPAPKPQPTGWVPNRHRGTGPV